MAHDTPLLCSSCGHRFTPDADAAGPLRCPKCFRTSGLVPADTSTGGPSRGASGGGAPRWLGAVLLVAVVGGVAAFVTLRDADDAVRPDGVDPAVTGEASGAADEDPLAKIPDALRLAPQAVDDAVKAAAGALSAGDAAAVVQAVRDARAAKKLVARGPDADLWGAPTPAGELAAALSGEMPRKAGTLELAALAFALLEAKGLGPVVFGHDPTAKGAATDVRRRRYVVRAAEGPWLDPVGERPVDQGAVVALDERTWLANVLCWRALGAVASVDAEAASQATSYAKALAPEDPATAFLAGLAKLANGLAEMGLSDMEAAAAQGADAVTWFQLGVSAMQVSQPFKAHGYLTKAADLDANYPDPHVMLAELTLERFETTPKPDQPKLREQLEAHLSRAQQIDANAVGVRVLRAQLAVRDQDYDTAEGLLAEECEVNPDDERSWVTYAGFLRARDKADEALEALEEAAGDGHDGAEIAALRGALLAEQGDLAGAKSALERALELDPLSRELRPQLAQVAKAMGDEQAATEAFEAHVSQFPGDVEGRLLAAQHALDQGKLAVSSGHVEAARKLTASRPEIPVLSYILALRGQGDVGETRQAALAAVGQPSSLAQVLMDQGFEAEAETLLRDAVERVPEDLLAPVMLASVLYLTGRKAEAAEFRQAQVAKAPEGERETVDARFEMAFEQIEEALEQAKAQAEAEAEGADVPAP